MDFRARDALVADFRHRVAHANNIIPLLHQAEINLASSGWAIDHRPPEKGDFYVDVIQRQDTTPLGAMVLEKRDIRDTPCYLHRVAIVPRTSLDYSDPAAPRRYECGSAHILADLTGFKGGKSFNAGLWASGFAILPAAKVHIVGLEYSTCEPEFSYLLDMLCSERGMNMKYEKLDNDVNHGRMLLRLTNGMTFQCRSWARDEGLKGKTITAYLYAEAYQLPDFSVYTRFSQNLREMEGFALFPTTPDKPWVSVFHEHGHGEDPDWHCCCCVHARENPYTFSQKAMDRDDPSKGGIMTRERFGIAWEGKLGEFIGRVYNFNKGDASFRFSPETHPTLWKSYDPWRDEMRAP